jgi:predicted  nucleic acid-binding Zn-ribbon protein
VILQAVRDQIKTLEAEVETLQKQQQQGGDDTQQQQQQLQQRENELAAAKAAALGVLHAAVEKRKQHEAQEHPDGRCSC